MSAHSTNASAIARSGWMQQGGRLPTLQHAIARLRAVMEDGLEIRRSTAPDDLARQAAALEQARSTLSAIGRGGVRCEPHIRGPARTCATCTLAG